MHHIIAIMAQGKLFFAVAMTRMLNTSISTFSSAQRMAHTSCTRILNVAFQLHWILHVRFTDRAERCSAT
jgi:hypothetical protein